MLDFKSEPFNTNFLGELLKKKVYYWGVFFLYLKKIGFCLQVQVLQASSLSLDRLK